MNEHYTMECLGYPIFKEPLKKLPKKRGLTVNTVNQYSYCLAKNDPEFKQVLQQSDVLLPDGIGIVWAAKFLNHTRLKKVAGADLHDFLLKKLDREKSSCFYLGSSPETLQKLTERLAKEYPNIRVGSYSPPFKEKFTAEDNLKMVAEVNAFAPEVLFLGMTAPKQEKWSQAHKGLLDVGMLCSIGAVFDFYAGTVPRPSKQYVDHGLEWLGRLIQEPKRMWRRYLYYGAMFGYYLLQEKNKEFKFHLFDER
ncbi:MAG: WecB/TagA/CpsF family glycosyltransferase [Flavobacteriaceae bacterium]